MSKLSFRARALDATKSMPIYRKDEVSDLPDYSVLNRAVPQMPTGMEKEEESEHHLQRAISAQQVYGDKKVMVIPVPEAEVGVEYYNNIYKKPFRVPKQYIHNQAQALNSIMEQEKPDYDMDSDDEKWVKETNKRTGLDISEIQFEEMIDRLEKSCGNQVVSLQEAKLLLKEDDDLIKAVYDYWLQKRAKLSGSLCYQVRQERRDGSSSGDSYVAFRRRTEKMQTRKNRKNDEASYEKMLKLRRDLSRAVTILEMIKRREKSKWELLHLSLEIAEKRYQMKDWDSKCLKAAKRDVAVSSGNLKAINRTKHLSGNKSIGGNLGGNLTTKLKLKSDMERDKKKRSKKSKHERLRLAAQSPLVGSSSPSVNGPVHSSPHKVPHSMNEFNHRAPLVGSTPKSPGSAPIVTYQQAVDTMRQYEFHSSDEETSRPPKSPVPGVTPSPDERKKNPDGVFAFRRKSGCKYNEPREDLSGDNWPWMTDDRNRYSLTTLTMPEKCMGFCRRRVGRGGRVLMDRAYTPWNKQLSEIDLHPESNYLPHKPDLQQLLEEIKHGRWRRYRPYDPLSHKAHKLKHEDNQTTDLELKPFGHSSSPSKHSLDMKATKLRTDNSSDSETIDIMTTGDENMRADLLHKRMLQKSPNRSNSPLKSRSTPQKQRLTVHGNRLDKPSAIRALSALKTPESSVTQKTKAKPGRSQLKSSVVATSIPVTSHNTSVMPNTVATTFIGALPMSSPAKYLTNVSTVSSPKIKQTKKLGRYSLDQVKFGVGKGQDKVHATLMPMANTYVNSTTADFSSSKVSVTNTCVATMSAGTVSLTMTQPNVSGVNFQSLTQARTLAIDGITNATHMQRTTTVPVVMATLRLGNSTTSSASLGSYSLNSSSESSNSSGTVFITPSTRAPATKTSTSKMHVANAIPLTLANGNSTLVPTQYKNNQQGVLLGPQSLNLALTPTTPQKLSARTQLSISNSSGHTPAILIATPASGTHASNLPSHGIESIGAGGINLNQAKTVSINVARVQTSNSGIGQLITLQHPDGSNILSGTPTLNAQQLAATGIQIHPVTAGFKVGSNNKSLTVFSKRPRVQQSTGTATRTINIANSKQVATVNNGNKVVTTPSHITLVPDNRTNLSKPMISITHPQKNAAAVVLSAKNVPSVDQSCTLNTDGNQIPTPLSVQSENIVTDNQSLSSKSSKNNQPMEVT